MKSNGKKILIIATLLIALLAIFVITACAPKTNLAVDIEEIAPGKGKISGKVDDIVRDTKPGTINTIDAFKKFLKAAEIASIKNIDGKDVMQKLIKEVGQTEFKLEYVTFCSGVKQEYLLTAKFDLSLDASPGAVDQNKIAIEIEDVTNSRKIFGAYYLSGAFIVDSFKDNAPPIILEDINLNQIFRVSSETGIGEYIDKVKAAILSGEITLSISGANVEILGLALPIIIPLLFEINTPVTVDPATGDVTYEMRIAGSKLMAAIVPIVGNVPDVVNDIVKNMLKKDIPAIQDIDQLLDAIIGLFSKDETMNYERLKKLDFTKLHSGIRFKTDKKGALIEAGIFCNGQYEKDVDYLANPAGYQIKVYKNQEPQVIDLNTIPAEIRNLAEDYAENKLTKDFDLFSLNNLDLVLGLGVTAETPVDTTFGKLLGEQFWTHLDNYSTGDQKLLEIKKILNNAKDARINLQSTTGIEIAIQTDLDFYRPDNNKVLIELRTKGANEHDVAGRKVLLGIYLKGTDLLADLSGLGLPKVQIAQVDINTMLFLPAKEAIRGVLSNIASKGLVNWIMGLIPAKQEGEEGASGLFGSLSNYSITGNETEEEKRAIAESILNDIGKEVSTKQLTFGPGGEAQLQPSLMGTFARIIKKIGKKEGSPKIIQIRIEKDDIKNIFGSLVPLIIGEHDTKIEGKFTKVQMANLFEAALTNIIAAVTLEFGLKEIDQSSTGGGIDFRNGGFRFGLGLEFNNLDNPDAPSKTKIFVGLEKLSIGFEPGYHIIGDPDGYKSDFDYRLGHLDLTEFIKLHDSTTLQFGISLEAEISSEELVSGNIGPVFAALFGTNGTTQTSLIFEEGYSFYLGLDLLGEIDFDLGSKYDGGVINSIDKVKELFANIKQHAAGGVANILKDIRATGLIYTSREAKAAKQPVAGVKLENGMLYINLEKLSLPNASYKLDLLSLIAGAADKKNKEQIIIANPSISSDQFVWVDDVNSSNPQPGEQPAPKAKPDMMLIGNIITSVVGGIQLSNTHMSVLIAENALVTMVKAFSDIDTGNITVKVPGEIKAALVDTPSDKGKINLQLNLEFQVPKTGSPSEMVGATVGLGLNNLYAKLGKRADFEEDPLVKAFFGVDTKTYVSLSDLIDVFKDPQKSKDIWAEVHGKMPITVSTIDRKLSLKDVLDTVVSALQESNPKITHLSAITAGVDLSKLLLAVELNLDAKVNITALMKFFKLSKEEQTFDEILKLINNIDGCITLKAEVGENEADPNKHEMTLGIYKKLEVIGGIKYNNIYIRLGIGPQNESDLRLKLDINEFAKFIHGLIKKDGNETPTTPQEPEKVAASLLSSIDTKALIFGIIGGLYSISFTKNEGITIATGYNILDVLLSNFNSSVDSTILSILEDGYTPNTTKTYKEKWSELYADWNSLTDLQKLERALSEKDYKALNKDNGLQEYIDIFNTPDGYIKGKVDDKGNYTAPKLKDNNIICKKFPKLGFGLNAIINLDLFPVVDGNQAAINIGAAISLKDPEDSASSQEFLKVKLGLEGLGLKLANVSSELDIESGRAFSVFKGTDADLSGYKDIKDLDNIILDLSLDFEVIENVQNGLSLLIENFGLSLSEEAKQSITDSFKDSKITIDIKVNIPLGKFVSDLLSAPTINAGGIVVSLLSSAELSIDITAKGTEKTKNILSLGYTGGGYNAAANTSRSLIISSDAFGINKTAISIPSAYMQMLAGVVNKPKENENTANEEENNNNAPKIDVLDMIMKILASKVFASDTSGTVYDISISAAHNRAVVKAMGSAIRNILLAANIDLKETEVSRYLNYIALRLGVSEDPTVDDSKLALNISLNGKDQNEQIVTGAVDVAIKLRSPKVTYLPKGESIFGDLPAGIVVVDLAKVKYVTLGAKLDGIYSIKENKVVGFASILNPILEHLGYNPLQNLDRFKLNLDAMQAKITIDLKANVAIGKLLSNIANIKNAKDDILADVLNNSEIFLNVNLNTPNYNPDGSWDPDDAGKNQTFMRVIYSGKSKKTYVDIPLIGVRNVGLDLDILDMINALKKPEDAANNNSTSLSMDEGEEQTEKEKKAEKIFDTIGAIVKSISSIAISSEGFVLKFGDTFLSGLLTELLGKEVSTQDDFPVEVTIAGSFATATKPFGLEVAFEISKLNTNTNEKEVITKAGIRIDKLDIKFYEKLTDDMSLLKPENQVNYVPEDAFVIGNYNFVDINRIIAVVKDETLSTQVKVANIFKAFQSGGAHIGVDLSLSITSTTALAMDILKIVRAVAPDYVPDNETLMFRLSGGIDNKLTLGLKGNVDMFDMTKSEILITLDKKVTGQPVENLLEIYFDGREKVLYANIPLINVTKIKIVNMDDIVGLLMQLINKPQEQNQLNAPAQPAAELTDEQKKAKTNKILEAVDLIIGSISIIEVNKDEFIKFTIDGGIFTNLSNIINCFKFDPTKPDDEQETTKIDLSFLSRYIDNISFSLKVLDGFGLTLGVDMKLDDATPDSVTTNLKISVDNFDIELNKIVLVDDEKLAALKEYVGVDISRFGSTTFGIDVSLKASIAIGGKDNEPSGYVGFNLYNLVYNLLDEVIKKKSGGIDLGTFARIVSGEPADPNGYLGVNVANVAKKIIVQIEGNIDLSSFDVSNIITKSRIAVYLSIADFESGGAETNAAKFVTAMLDGGMLYVKVHGLEANEDAVDIVNFKLDLAKLINKDAANADLSGSSLSMDPGQASEEEQIKKTRTQNIVKSIFKLVDEIAIDCDKSVITIDDDTNISAELKTIFENVVIKNKDGSIPYLTDEDGNFILDPEGNKIEETLYDKIPQMVKDILNKLNIGPIRIHAGLPGKDQDILRLALALSVTRDKNTIVQSGLMTQEAFDAQCGDTKQYLGFALALNDMAASLMKVDALGKLEYRTDSALNPFDDAQKAAFFDFGDFSSLRGLYAGLKLEVDVPEGKQFTREIGEMIQNMNDFGQPVVAQIKELLQAIKVAITLSTNNLGGKYKFDIRLMLGTLDFSDFSITTFKKISALVNVTRDPNGNGDLPLMKVIFHEGVAYFDGAPDANGNGGMTFFTTTLEKVKIDLSELLSTFGISTYSTGSSLSMGETRDIKTIKVNDVLPIIKSINFTQEELSINLNLQKASSLLNDMLGINLGFSKDAKIAIGFKENNFSLKAGIMYGDNKFAGLSLEDINILFANEGLVTHPSFTNLSNTFITDAEKDEYQSYENLKFALSLDFSLELSNTAYGVNASNNEYLPLDWLFGINKLSALSGSELGLGMKIADNTTKTIKISIDAVIALGDFIGKTPPAEYGSSASILISVTGYSKPIGIYTNFKEVYIDAEALKLPKFKIEMDIFELIKGSAKKNKNVELPYSNSNLSMAPKVDAFELLPKLLKEISLGNDNISIDLQGNLIAEIFKLIPATKDLVLPSELTFDDINLFVNLEDNNANNVVQIDDIYANITLKKTNVADLAIKIDNIKGGLSSDATLKADTTAFGDITTYPSYKELKLDIEVEAFVNLDTMGGIEREQMPFLALKPLLEGLLNKADTPEEDKKLFSQFTRIYSNTRHAPNTLIKSLFKLSIRLRADLSEIFSKDEPTTKTLALSLRLTDVNPDNPSQETTLIDIRYCYDSTNKGNIFVEIPILGIAGVKIEGIDLVKVLRDALDPNKIVKVVGTSSATSSLSMAPIPEGPTTNGRALILLEDYKDANGKNRTRLGLQMNSEFVSNILNLVSENLEKPIAILDALSETISDISSIRLFYDRGNEGEAFDGKLQLNIDVTRDEDTYMDLGLEAGFGGMKYGADYDSFDPAAPENANIVIPANAADFMALNLEDLMDGAALSVDKLPIKQLDIELGGSLTLALDKPDTTSILPALINKLMPMIAEDFNPEIVFKSANNKELVFTFLLQARLDISDIDNFRKYSQFALTVNLNDKTLAIISYSGFQNSLFIDLENIGLMKARIMGLDLAGLLSGMLFGSSSVDFTHNTISGGALSSSSLSTSSSTLSMGPGQDSDLSRVEILIEMIKNADPYFTSTAVQIDINYHCINAIIDMIGKSKEKPINFSLPAMNDIQIIAKFNTADKNTDPMPNGRRKGVESIEININLDNTLANGTGREANFAAAKNKLSLKIDTFKINEASHELWDANYDQTTGLYEGELENYAPTDLSEFSAINLGDLNQLLKKDVSQIKALVHNLIEMLTGRGNKAALELYTANSSSFYNYFDKFNSGSALRFAELLIKRDKAGANNATKDNLQIQFRDGSTQNAFDLTIWLNIPSMNIKVETLEGAQALVNLLVAIWPIKIDALGAIDKLFVVGTPDAPIAEDNISGDVKASAVDIKALIKGIELQVGGGNIIALNPKGAIETSQNNTTVKINFDVYELAKLLNKLKLMLFKVVNEKFNNEDFAPNDSSEQLVKALEKLIYEGLLLEVVPNALKPLLRGNGMKNTLIKVLDVILSRILPLPNFEKAGVGAEAYVKLLLSSDLNSSEKMTLIRAAQIRIDNGNLNDQDRWELVLINNGLLLEIVQETGGSINDSGRINPNDDKHNRILDPFNLDRDSNGRIDYLEDLPEKATVRPRNQFGQFSGGDISVSLGWATKKIGNSVIKIDPTQPTVDGESNYLTIVGSAMNREFIGSGQYRIVTLPAEGVRRPIYDSKGNPSISAPGLELPLVIDQSKEINLPNTITVRMEDATAQKNEYSYTFSASNGDTVKWDTSNVPKLGKSVKEGKNFVTLTFGNGSCKDVIISVPFILLDKKAVKITDPININPYEFIQKGFLKSFTEEKRNVSFRNQNAPILCEIKWGDKLLGGGTLSKFTPSYFGQTIYVEKVEVGTAEIGFQSLYNVPITFAPAFIKNVTFKELDVYTTFNTNMFDAYAQATTVENGIDNVVTNKNNYPKKADITFEDGSVLVDYPITWDLSKVTSNIYGKAQDAKWFIGTKGTSSYQVNTHQMNLMDREVLFENVELKPQNYTYDLFGSQEGILPNNAKYYIQENADGTMPETINVTFKSGEVRAVKYSLDVSDVKLSYKGEISYAKLNIILDDKIVQTIKIAIRDIDRRIVNVIWTNDDDTKAKYPLTVDPYSPESINMIKDESKLPTNIKLIFADGSSYDNTDSEAVSWSTLGLITNYEGNDAFITATIEKNGTKQSVKVKVKVQKKIGVKIILNEDFDIDNAATYPSEAIIMFADGTIRSFSGISCTKTADGKLSVRFGTTAGGYQEFEQVV